MLWKHYKIIEIWYICINCFLYYKLYRKIKETMIRNTVISVYEILELFKSIIRIVFK